MPQWVDAADEFIYVLVEGTEKNPIRPRYRESMDSQKNGRYFLKVGIMPKSKGTFSVVFGNAANVYRKNDKCTKANFTLNFKNTNQHYYLSPFYQGGAFVGDYYFKVY